METSVVPDMDGPAFQDIVYEKRDGVATVTINRPEVLNATTGITQTEIVEALLDASEDAEIGVVVLTGAGDRAFCVGADVRWMKTGGHRDYYVSQPDVRHAMRMCPKPIIAKVKGYAIGGGHHLAYFCDLTLAADNAVFGQNGAAVGSPAGDYVVSYLARCVGQKRAREIWYLCRQYDAQTALAMGLANAVVPLDELDAEVDRWCQEILDKSPVVIRTLKESFDAELDPLRVPVFHTQRLVASGFLGSPENREGATAFVEKRKPDFRQYR
jgi:dihydroxynaphthoic acid synthetase